MEMSWQHRLRALAMQSGFFRFISVVGLLGGVFWGCGFWLLWMASKQIFWPTLPYLDIGSLAIGALGFGLTMAVAMWLMVLWERRRMKRGTRPSTSS